MTLIDLDRKDVQNYTNKDGLIGVSDLRMLALTDDYVNVEEILEIIDKFKKKPVRCKDIVYVIDGDELWNAIKLHLTTEIMKLRGDKSGMTAERAVEILENEKACVLKANTCGRDCGKCDLVLPDTEILEAYNMAIEELKGGE